MILFAADNHYGTHPGKVLMEHIGDEWDIDFHEDDWRCFNEPGLEDRCDLLILNLISGSCDVPPPGAAAEAVVRTYVETGGNMLLLHGASAAFWQWDWWRPLVGHRWVRGDDPDGFAPSTHPKRPFEVKVAKCRHPLCARLHDVSLPEDEIYINMEQTRPTTVLMTTTTDEGTFVQAYETHTPWGGTILGYIPGHAPEVVAHPHMVQNVEIMIDALLVSS